MFIRQTKYILLFTICSVLFSSCNDEMEIVNSPADTEQGTENTDNDKTEIVYKTLVITASANGTATRTSYEENGNTIKAYWSEDDFIYVGSPNKELAEEVNINAENSGFTKFALKTLSPDKKTASFEGTVAVAQNTTNILAFYGDANYIKVNKEGVKLNFETQSQSINTLNDIEKYELMTASAELSTDETQNISLTFNHENAVFKLNVGAVSNVEKFDELTISFPDNQELGFYSNVTFNTDGTKTFGSPVNSLKVILGDGKGSGAEFSAYCLLRTTEISAASKFNIKAIESKSSGDYIYSYNLKVSSPIIENKFYYTPELNLAIDNTLAGEGTEVSPYIIDNVDKFKGLSNSSGMYYQLSRDLDFTNIAFTPITTFEGTLDGNGKTISNLTIAATNNKCGFIGNNTGTIRNLNINNVTLEQAIIAGAIAAENNGTIDNCHVQTGLVQGSATNECIGGFVGNNKATITSSSIQDIEVIAEPTTNTNAGGFVGKSETTNCNIIGSYVGNGCTITLSNGYQTTNRIGGFVGSHWGGNIYGCYSNTTITINAQGDIGGFAGLIQSPTGKNVQVCYSFGSITNNLNWKTGGFVGNIYNSIGNITSCYSLVSINITNSVNNAKTNGFAGDKSGSNSPTITACYTNQNVNNNLGTKITDIATLRSKITEMNNAASSSGFEFVIGSTDAEPLIIQKKQ